MCKLRSEKRAGKSTRRPACYQRWTSRESRSLQFLRFPRCLRSLKSCDETEAQASGNVFLTVLNGGAGSHGALAPCVPAVHLSFFVRIVGLGNQTQTDRRNRGAFSSMAYFFSDESKASHFILDRLNGFHILNNQHFQVLNCVLDHPFGDFFDFVLMLPQPTIVFSLVQHAPEHHSPHRRKQNSSETDDSVN